MYHISFFQTISLCDLVLTFGLAVEILIFEILPRRYFRNCKVWEVDNNYVMRTLVGGVGVQHHGVTIYLDPWLCQDVFYCHI